MLKLTYTDHYDYPMDVVFSVYRDRQAEYTKYVPNLRKVVILKREQRSDHEVFLSVEWHGFGQIPAAVRSILHPHMIKWKDTQLWDSTKMTNEWTIEPYFFREFVECKGKWSFFPEGDDRTRIELDGHFSVNITHFPGVPKVILRQAGGVIEKFIGRYVKPNLVANSKGIKKFFEAEIGKKGQQ
ncbi:MAG: hypothetical protein AB1742_03120 [bacterium]